MVGPPLHAVGHPLDVNYLHAGPEARENLLAVIGDAFAGAVFEAPDVRSRDNVESTVGPNEAGGPREIIGEDAARLVIAVAVLVFED